MEEPIVSTRKARWGNYVVAFIITTAIFVTAFYASTYFSNKRVAEIQSAQENIAVDILSLETQFELLAEHSCMDISENSVLSTGIRPLGERLAYLESQVGVNSDELTQLKRYYSLLQLKDLLLMQKVADKCKLKPIFILYFYSNEGDCEDCEEQGYVLTALSETYPQLRVYSFDYNLDLPALQTLVQIHNVENTLPALVINGVAHYGFKDIEDIHQSVPALATLKKATSTPSSTSTRD